MNLRQLIFSNTLSKNCWSKHLGQLFIVTSLSAAFPLWDPKISQKTSRVPLSSRAVRYPLRKRERVPWLKKIRWSKRHSWVKSSRASKKSMENSSNHRIIFVQWRLCDTTSRGVNLFGEMVHLHWLATEHLLWSIGRRPPSITGDLQAEHPDIPKSHTNPRVSFQLVLMVQQ